MSEQRLTIRDVAARAGVSRAAVSLAFNNKPGVSEATRARIIEVARAMGWEPNRSARALNKQGTGTIGLAISRPARQLGLEPFYMEFISGLESVVSDHSGGLLLRLVKSLDEEIELQRHWWRSGQIAGSVLVDFREHDPRVPVLSQLGLPAVAVAHPSLMGPFTSLWTDDTTAVTEAVRYLAALGHRSIARVGGTAELGHSVIRGAAFGAAVADLGLPEGRQLATDFSGDAGARATRSLLAWDDSQLCKLTHPTLSAMSHDIHAFGADVARSLYEVLAGGRVAAHQVPTPALTPRGSTGPPPGRE
ncbi:LacI family transcriptional regulator [Streptomyces venezuelae]|uniref:LacI family transcriptional regulator n=1 Tax=Streptomyces venezuelae TaxID=54571 RepID=A0A5P2CUI4_STRVZ|nr:LacI family DNA-binding transcriptional regulator [Streptomyces venezuelae]QES45418.1 LacI family transcriptional regulator [Streptomyces venezuelae]